MFTIGFCNSGVSSKVQTLENISYNSFAEFTGSFSKCAQGVKDGAYFTRTGGTVRSSEGLNDTTNVLILDGDSSIDLESGVITPGAPNPKLVHEALKGLRLNHFIYPSYSHKPGELNKYRVLIECSYNKTQLFPTIEFITSLLWAKGLMLTNVSESNRWAQPWYLPRRENPKDYWFYRYLDGKALAPSNTKSEIPKENLEKKVRIFRIPTVVNPIDVFNDHYKSPMNYLLTQGYKWVNGGRMVRPGSSTGQGGVVVMPDSGDGKVRVYSHGNDKLNNGKALDAFDCYVILEHDGIIQSALMVVGNYLKVNGLPYLVHNAKVRKKIKIFKAIYDDSPDELKEYLIKSLQS